MTRQTEVDVENLQKEMRLLRAVLEDLVQWRDMLEDKGVNNNAVVEGDEVTTQAARNGKIRKANR